jgi:hypothetical protein
MQESVVCAGSVLNFAVPQLVQSQEDVDAVLNFPATQADMKVPEPVKPASARHELTCVTAIEPPVPELVGHPVHTADDAVDALKVFEVQEVILLPEPVYPASAKQ